MNLWYVINFTFTHLMRGWLEQIHVDLMWKWLAVGWLSVNFMDKNEYTVLQKMTAFAGLNILIIRQKPSALLQRAHLQPSSLGAAVLYCVGEVQSTGSAGGSTSRRTAGGAEQRLTNSAGTTRGCVMLYLETRHLCSVLHSEPQWCTYQTAEKQKFTLSRREEKDSLF